MTTPSDSPNTRVVISLDVQQRGIVIGATVNGRFNAGYAARTPEQVPDTVHALVVEILGELRAQSLLGS